MSIPHSIQYIMSNYYDVILGLIPLAFLGIAGGLTVTGFTLTTAVTFAGLAGVLLVGHALFVNGPVDPTSPAQTPAQTPAQAPSTAPVDAD